MPKGRNLWEILTGKQPEDKGTDALYNPLNARGYDHVSLNVLDYRDDLWEVYYAQQVDMIVNGKHHKFAEYAIESDNKYRELLVFPKDGGGTSVLLMEQYYPENDSFEPYCEEVAAILEALNDSTGEFYRYRGEANEEFYVRLGGAIPLLAYARDLFDSHHDPDMLTIWDFHRDTKDEAGGEFKQFLYAFLSGHYLTAKSIRGGDKTLQILRGREIEANKVTIFGANK